MALDGKRSSPPAGRAGLPERRLLKVLKGLAEYHDITLGDLLEGIVLHVFEGKCPFGGESLEVIARLKKVYRLELDASDSHKLVERSA